MGFDQNGPNEISSEQFCRSENALSGTEDADSRNGLIGMGQLIGEQVHGVSAGANAAAWRLVLLLDRGFKGVAAAEQR